MTKKIIDGINVKIKIGVLIINNDKVLLLKEKIKKRNVPLWNIVKGSYGDNGDESVFDAASRECLEETSTRVMLTDALGCYISKEGTKLRIQFNFLAKIADGKPVLPNLSEQIKRDEHIIALRWFSKKEIVKMDPNEFISNRTHAILLDWIKGDYYPIKIFKHIAM